IWRRALFVRERLDRAVLVAALVVAGGALLLPWIDSRLGLAGSHLAERISGGRRPDAWGLFLDAARSNPWTGWGALQNGSAQFMLADRHPALAYFFSSAHNVVLDLMVWFGIPVGLLAGLVLLVAAARRVARAADSASMAPALAAVMLLLHGMVELPLQYAYFLFPLGFYLGLGGPGAGPALRMPMRLKPLLPVVALASFGVLALLASEYIRVTDVRPALAYDRKYRTFTLEADEASPQVVLLDQLRAFHEFAALPTAPGRSRSELEMARESMLRLPLRASIERYALLAGLNGQGAAASEALSRLCKFVTQRQCDDSQRVWLTRRQQWPELPEWPDPAVAAAPTQ
ncbi:MAG TPA: Wzy polymerase domain-containing protein, partial [Burkholderiaceae bacterium]|nr:Wzy polymerase domain-containing protein [Burkholderiaceae bacterium]